MTDNYAATNQAWPATLPPITRHEARRAARKLMRHFAKRETAWLRRCWISTRPLQRETPRGWWRLVHDVSHRVFRLTNRNIARSHGGWHAELELEMVRYVIEHGWLEGKLKPAERKRVPMSETERRDHRLEHARRMLAKWERKAKLSATKVKLWTRRQAQIEKRAYLKLVGS